MTGIRMSISTTSGAGRAASSTASAPLAASPTTSRSARDSISTTKPARTSAWSSTTSTRIMPRHRRRRPADTAAGPRPGSRRRAAVRRSSVAAEERRPARACRSGRGPSPVRRSRSARSGRRRRVISTRPRRRRSAIATPAAAGPPCRSTLVSASCTIRYAERSSAGGQRRRVAGHGQLDGEAGGAELVDQPGDVAQPGAGRELAARLVAPRRSTPEQPAHLDQRRAGGGLDAAQRAPRALRPAVDDVVGHAGLDGDHAHRVGDHVVQLAGDPQPLRGHRPPGPLLALCSSRWARSCSAVHRCRRYRRFSPASQATVTRQDGADPRRGVDHRRRLHGDRDAERQGRPANATTPRPRPLCRLTTNVRANAVYPGYATKWPAE